MGRVRRARPRPGRCPRDETPPTLSARAVLRYRAPLAADRTPARRPTGGVVKLPWRGSGGRTCADGASCSWPLTVLRYLATLVLSRGRVIMATAGTPIKVDAQTDKLISHAAHFLGRSKK